MAVWGGPLRLPGPRVAPCCLTPGSHPNNLSLPLATTSWSVSGIRSATHGPLVTSGESKARLSDSTVPSLPDVEVHCAERRIEPTYSVRFESSELWGEAGDPVHADLWESYLEPIDG